MALLKAIWFAIKLILSGIAFDVAVDQASVKYDVDKMMLQSAIKSRGYERSSPSNVNEYTVPKDGLIIDLSR